MQQDNKDIENNNPLIADGLEDIALMFSMLEKGNLKQALTTIESGLASIDEIAQETDATVLRALTHWMSLNTELNEDNQDQINELLASDSYSNWIDVLASVLRAHDQSLLPILHQSLTIPNWPVKASAPLLKSVATWVEETRIENIENPHHSEINDTDLDVNDNTYIYHNSAIDTYKIKDDEILQQNRFEEIDISILNKEYDDSSTDDVLKEIQQHPDFKESLIENEKSSISIEDLDNELENENAIYDSKDKTETFYTGSCKEISNDINIENSKLIDTANDTNEQTDFCLEIDNIVMSLASITTIPNEVSTYTHKYLKELKRLSMLVEKFAIIVHNKLIRLVPEKY